MLDLIEGRMNDHFATVHGKRNSVFDNHRHTICALHSPSLGTRRAPTRTHI